MEHPDHVEFYSKNKFEILVHLVGFIIRITQPNPSKHFSFPDALSHTPPICLLDMINFIIFHVE
jgi:hypothetical protein